ncbi:MAG: metallophosphoesterase family protein [Actinomycetota bacterium]
MRIAALYDIHGNRPALEAVLREVEREKVDVILVGGDIAWGPFPRETVDILRQLDNAMFIRGNADREVARRLGIDDGLDNITADINLWAADELTNEQRKWLAQLDTTFVAEIDEIGDVLFCHGSPRSDEEPITPVSPPNRLHAAFSTVRERTITCGHTHIQFERDLGNHHVVNAGSVGIPYQGKPGAYWALLGPRIELRRSDYDMEATAAAMRRSDCPHVEEVFIETVLHPPATDEAARHFEAIATEKTY